MPVSRPTPQSRLLSHPARVVVLLFALAIAIGSLLLALPISTAPGEDTTPLTALFTATSAICVTGLIVVDTATHWSGFGKVVIVALIQLGGLGIMTLASVLALAFTRRLGLAARMATRAERSTLDLGDLGRVLRGVVLISFALEGLGALLLAGHFFVVGDQSAARSLWYGVFHAVSAFNNAGFSVFSDNLAGFATSWWVSLVVMVLIVAGGLGFPVLLELRRHWQEPKRWSLHTKLTLATTAVLLVVGFVAIIALEWNNDGTLGPLSWHDKLLAGAFHSVSPRTAGFNTVDIGAMNVPTWMVLSGLMFVGGGSASTAGGIKVSTLAVLHLSIFAELRGSPHITAFRRRIAEHTQREALAITLLALGVVVGGGLVVVGLSSFSLDQSLFEVTSAFGTVGLSTGITPMLPSPAKVLIVGMMFLGRLGPLTLGAALVLRRQERRYRYPEERPIVG